MVIILIWIINNIIYIFAFSEYSKKKNLLIIIIRIQCPQIYKENDSNV